VLTHLSSSYSVDAREIASTGFRPVAQLVRAHP
jgi:hypothetical protein